ncbi:unnamed protein product [Tenebrio molitor]|jgi:hypothetical protein|nr:unnamed protein product [Tenebrio molitor]
MSKNNAHRPAATEIPYIPPLNRSAVLSVQSIIIQHNTSKLILPKAVSTHSHEDGCFTSTNATLPNTCHFDMYYTSILLDYSSRFSCTVGCSGLKSSSEPRAMTTSGWRCACLGVVAALVSYAPETPRLRPPPRTAPVEGIHT